MNNRAVTENLTGLVSLAFTAVFAVFAVLFLQNLWADEILEPFSNKSLSVIENHGNNTDAYNLAAGQKGKFEDTNLQVDLLFLASWIGSTIIILFLSFIAERLSRFRFLTFLFIGNILFLLGMAFIDQTINYLVKELINGIFSATETNLPFFTFFVNNFILIAMLTYNMVLLVNQMGSSPREELGVDESETSFEGSFTEEESGDRLQ
jgi:hypothetical protein